MPIKLQKDSIDLGIVTANGPAMVAFYRDVLGFVEEPQTPFSGGGVMNRLRCGTSLIKIVAPAIAPAECQAAGRKLVVPVTEIRPGVTIAIVDDPDGNLVEFLQMG